ncbi:MULTISPECIES: response regulator transcription factor [Sporomusa]|uniref:Transcriptional regulatory protein DegU n=1 Tax=Sporomusa sphaeroides DSM 2875 TaxID=1337886 RepID=A0ABM9W442_9FIRM|nr:MULTISPECIES: response regulator transcription factor [Sporomusa]MCM0758049.1 response regulator transcription factor [Sporomusa sphaeroides DSM 2875]OLS55549.1 transcriptional regulatory protein DegU [Sporomusa sphaeroides DSM 2875]CVK19914.1 Transcriptional regulatory protein DegU [Sporomusa sphaeroides DSM 2875]
MPIRIVIADDHALLRQGIKNVLSLEPDLEVVGEAADGDEAISKVESLAPDILLLDVNMPRMTGLEVTKRLKKTAKSPVKVIILTIHDDESYVIEVIKSGAVGYLLKDIEPGMLVKAIRMVHEGHSFIYPTLATQLFGELSRQDEKRNGALVMLERPKEERLTYREVEVLQLIGQGMNNQEIAQTLYLSEKTVKNHLTNIFRKINVVDRTQAVLYAIKHKIVILE